jgi:hypothetical protein
MGAIEDIAAERQRQIAIEGWAVEHDDGHTDGALAQAAAAYAIHSSRLVGGLAMPLCWPWHASWWKPGEPRQDLIKAGALIVAEIERLDRAAAAGKLKRRR